MNRNRILGVFLFLALTITISASAQQQQAPVQQTQPQPAKTLKPQSLCLVSGKPIDSAFYTDTQGQRVYFCCGKCPAAFKADPDKYFKKAAADGVLLQNVQKNCPVTGEAIDKTVYVDYEGRRVYFCCKACEKSFAKDPQTYLKKLDQPAPAKETAPKPMPGDTTGHMGHMGH